MNAKAVDSAGVVCRRGGAVLLIRRARPPFQGRWSIPGGKIEPGETPQQTARRELFEETGVEAEIGALIAVIETEAEGYRYRLHDFEARWIAGEPRAGDDALEAAFFPVEAALKLVEWDETRKVIRPRPFTPPPGAPASPQSRRE
ncbi:MAG: NUDIX hydrolase [Maricaulaceae bacterium]|nr:NUDIX hydrolase [Maricaulaceae bacterium]